MEKEMTWNEFASEFKPIKINDKRADTGGTFHVIHEFLQFSTRGLENWPQQHIGRAELFLETKLIGGGVEIMGDDDVYCKHYDTCYIITRKPFIFNAQICYYKIHIDDSKKIYIDKI